MTAAICFDIAVGNNKQGRQLQERPVYIHLGAHRTGSSSFQACLGENRAALEAAGADLAYPGRDGAAGGRLRLKLPEPSQPDEIISQRLQTAAHQIERFVTPDARALVISEENVLGRMMQFYSGGFYDDAVFRLGHLRQILPGPVDTAMLVVRPYDEVFVSAHRKLAAMRKRPSFEELRPALLAIQRGWADVVEDIQQALRPRRLIVVAHQTGQKSHLLLERLCDGLDPGPLRSASADRVNASATDAALIEIQRRIHAGEKMSPEACDELQQQYADAKADTAFARFSKNERDEMWTRYENDLVAIAERLHTRAEVPI